MTLVEIMRLFLPVHEIHNADGTTSNRGLWVEAIQHAAGGQYGDSWCLELVWDCLYLERAGKPPFDRGYNCDSLLRLAQSNGWTVTVGEPEPGDLVIFLEANGRGHHIAVYTGPSGDDAKPWLAIAGNTSADGTSANGDRVAEHPISRQSKTLIRLPL